jgi:hypothetical protein
MSKRIVYWFLKVPRQPPLIAVTKGGVGRAGGYKQPSEECPTETKPNLPRRRREGDEKAGRDARLGSEEVDGPENWVRGEMFKEYGGSI